MSCRQNKPLPVCIENKDIYTKRAQSVSTLYTIKCLPVDPHFRRTIYSVMVYMLPNAICYVLYSKDAARLGAQSRIYLHALRGHKKVSSSVYSDLLVEHIVDYIF